MLTQEEQADLDFINEMATTNPSNLTDEDWDLAEKLEKKAKEATGGKSPEEIKARGEEAYKQMMGDIDTEYDKAYVEDNYGWVKNNPITNFGMSLIAPSSVESIDAGEIPSWGDIGIDVGINAAGLAATPERVALTAGKALPKLGRLLAPSASRLKNIAVGAVEQGAVAGAGEGALSAQHDRDYSLTAPLAGTVAGGAIGGTATTSMAKKLLDAGYPQDEIADVMRKLGTTEKGTLAALGRKNLKELGVKHLGGVDSYGIVSIPSLTGDIEDIKRSVMVQRYKNPMKSTQEKLKDLQELEDALTTRQILTSEDRYKTVEALKNTPNIDKSFVDKFRQPSNNEPISGVLQDIDEVITDKIIKNRLLSAVSKKTGLDKELKSVLDKAKYQELLQKTPDIIESGTILGTVKNVAESAPHSIKTARDVLKAPITVAERTKERKEKPKKEEPKYTNRSGYSSDGDLLYAPRGYITYEDLWKEAEKIKKKIPSLEIH